MIFGRTGAVSRIAVFLGNPGAEYKGTRHNAGFIAASCVEREKGVRINRLRFEAQTAQCLLGGEKTLLLKPLTFMNLSGRAVSQAACFYKIKTEDVIVIADDVSLPPGKLRIRSGGSAGGHNGLKSIIEALGSDGFPRIKIGVGAPEPPGRAMADWVLSAPQGEEARLIAGAAERAAEAIEVFIRDGAQAAMNGFN